MNEKMTRRSHYYDEEEEETSEWMWEIKDVMLIVRRYFKSKDFITVIWIVTRVIVTQMKEIHYAYLRASNEL